MVDKIKTAEEFLNTEEYYSVSNDFDTRVAMIAFAKYHVKMALQESLESIPCLGSSTDIPSYEEVEKEVLNSYPENNIK